MTGIIDSIGWRDAPKLLLAFYAGFWLALLVHELGHYVALRAVGIVPAEVSVGHWGPTFVSEWEGTRFVFRPLANPLGRASTTVGPGEITAAALVAVLLAGSAANAAGGLLVLGLGLVERSAFLLMIALAFVAMGIGQLVPVGATDGSVALEVVRSGKVPEGMLPDGHAKPPDDAAPPIRG